MANETKKKPNQAPKPNQDGISFLADTLDFFDVFSGGDLFDGTPKTDTQSNQQVTETSDEKYEYVIFRKPKPGNAGNAGKPPKLSDTFTAAKAKGAPTGEQEQTEESD